MGAALPPVSTDDRQPMRQRGEGLEEPEGEAAEAAGEHQQADRDEEDPHGALDGGHVALQARP